MLIDEAILLVVGDAVAIVPDLLPKEVGKLLGFTRLNAQAAERIQQRITTLLANEQLKQYVLGDLAFVETNRVYER